MPPKNSWRLNATEILWHLNHVDNVEAQSLTHTSHTDISMIHVFSAARLLQSFVNLCLTMLRQICSEFKARKPRPSKEWPNVTLILPVQYPFEGVGRWFPLGMDKRLLYTASRSLPKNPFPKPPSSDLHLQKHAFQTWFKCFLEKITVVDSTPSFNCKIAPSEKPEKHKCQGSPKGNFSEAVLGQEEPKARYQARSNPMGTQSGSGVGNAVEEVEGIGDGPWEMHVIKIWK